MPTTKSFRSENEGAESLLALLRGGGVAPDGEARHDGFRAYEVINEIEMLLKGHRIPDGAKWIYTLALGELGHKSFRIVKVGYSTKELKECKKAATIERCKMAKKLGLPKRSLPKFVKIYYKEVKR